MLNGVEAAALAVARVRVNSRADDQVTLVRLADIGVDGAAHDDGGQYWLQRLRYQGLQGGAFDRQPDVSHAGDNTGMCGGDHRDLFGLDEASCRIDPSDRAVFATDTG